MMRYWAKMVQFKTEMTWFITWRRDLEYLWFRAKNRQVWFVNKSHCWESVRLQGSPVISKWGNITYLFFRFIYSSKESWFVIYWIIYKCSEKKNWTIKVKYELLTWPKQMKPAIYKRKEKRKEIKSISIYTVSDLGDSSNLIGSLSRTMT